MILVILVIMMVIVIIVMLLWRWWLPLLVIMVINGDGSDYHNETKVMKIWTETVSLVKNQRSLARCKNFTNMKELWCS